MKTFGHGATLMTLSSFAAIHTYWSTYETAKAWICARIGLCVLLRKDVFTAFHRTMTQVLADFREMVEEQIQYRELLYQMMRRDLLLRYKQTVMGFGWAIFMPLLNTVVFSMIFTRVAPIDVGMPYPLFAFCGLLACNFSASSFRFALTSLTTNTNLVTKVYFPREIFPVSSMLVLLVDFAVASTVLVVLLVYYGVRPSAALAALPVIVIVHVMFTTSVCLLFDMSNL